MDDFEKLAKEFVERAEENARKNPTSNEIQVVVIEPFKKPYKMTIPNKVDAFNSIIGGHMENVFIGETDTGSRVAVVVNEEGKLIGLPINRVIAGVGYEVLVGNIVITAYNYQGDNVSLTDEQADKFINQFSSLNVFL